MKDTSALKYLKRKYGSRLRRSSTRSLRKNKVAQALSSYTPQKHAERMIGFATDMLNNAALSPYLTYYLSNRYGDDDPHLPRKTIIDNLQIPTNLPSSERWEMVEILLNNATNATKRKNLLIELKGYLQESTPDCATLRACVSGCEVSYPSFQDLPDHSHRLRPSYFASGSNKAGEIRGFTESGVNVGVAADEVYGTTQDQKNRRKALKEVEGKKSLSGELIKVFIDSGAFGEVSFDPRTKTFKDKDKITHQDWLKIFKLYNEIGNALGKQAYIVAPDKVGDQAESFRRIKKYLPLLESRDVNIIVPIPPVGKMINYDRQVRQFFGSDFIRGIPTVQTKGGATPSQIKEYVEDLYADRSVSKPVRIHLLGMGLLPKGRAKQSMWEKTLRPMLEKIDPNMEVFLDSVRMASITAKGGLPWKRKAQKRALEKFELLKENLTPKDIDELYKKLNVIEQTGKKREALKFFEKEWRKKWQPFALQKDKVMQGMLDTSVSTSDEYYIGGEVYSIPNFYEFYNFPHVWLSKKEKDEILTLLIDQFPPMYEDTEGETEFKDIGMTPENIALFKKSPTQFLKKYYVTEDGDVSRYADLMEFLWGDAFLYIEYHRFLDPKKGAMMRAFSRYILKALVQDINEAVLLSLPPKVKGITLRNPRGKRMARRRNPLYESELSEGRVEICDDYDTDANCAFGSEDSELYHAATQYRSAWKRAKEAQRSRKGFPDRQPSGTPCPTTQILYDGLGRQYISEYKVFRTNDDGSGAIIPSNEPTSFWSIKTYPKALQARDLATTAEKLKITKMAQTLDPARLLTHHADATLGAPVVWEGKKGKYFVLAGNGRTIALLMAPKDKYAEYERLGKKKWGGIWPKGKDPKGKRSILVRVIRHADGKNLTERQAVQFAGGSQVSTSGAETPIREALSYMRALGVNKRELPYFEWYGEVNADNALKFARLNQAFTTEILSRLSPAQKARISSDPWVLAKTISMVLAGFVPLEIVDEGFSSVKEEEALLSFLPALVYLQKLIDDGQAKEKWNLLPHLIGAKFFLQAVRKLSYGKSITWIEEELPFLKKQTGMFGGGEDPLKNLTPLGIGLGMFLKRAVQASDPASKSVALKGYIQDALSASKTNMFGAPQSTITPVESIGEHLLGKQLGKKFVGAIMKTFGKQNPRRRNARKKLENLTKEDAALIREILKPVERKYGFGHKVKTHSKGSLKGTVQIDPKTSYPYPKTEKFKQYGIATLEALRDAGYENYLAEMMSDSGRLQTDLERAKQRGGVSWGITVKRDPNFKEDRIVVRDEDIGGFRSYSALQSYMEDQIVKSGYKISGEPRMSSVGSKQTGLIILFGKGSYLFGFLAEKGELSFQYSEKKKVKEDLKFPFSTLAEAKKIVKNLLGCIPQVVGEIKAQSAPPAPPQPSEKTLKMIKEIAKYAIAEFEIDLEADLTLPPSAQNSFGLMLSQTYKTPSKYRLPTTWDLSLYKLNKAEPLMLKIHSKGMDGIERKPLDIEVEIKSTSQGKSVIDDFISCVQDRVSTKEIPKKPVKSPPKKPAKKPAKKPVKKPTAKPKKKRSYSRKPKNHIVVWDGKKTTVKTDRASNVWATYVDEDDYSMVTHLPSGLDVYESESLHEARQVMTDLGKKFKNWEIDLTVGQMPIQAKRKSMREFLEQYK